MNKKLIFLVIGVVITIALVSLLFLNKDNSNKGNVNNQTDTSSQTVSEESSLKSSLKALAESGTNKECTINDNGQDISGKLYIGNNKLRGEFLRSTEGKQNQVSIIVLPNKQYVWDTVSKKGFVFAFDKNDAQKPQNSVDINKEYEYSCKNWQLDENKFIQPSDVQFQDLTKLQEQIQNIPRF